ncbi:MAG: hypothetical protein ABSB35_18185 [Bryobacteraceae bacterium]
MILGRDATTRLTFTGKANAPVWTPDGKHLIFRTVSPGSVLFLIRSDGGGEPQRLLEGQTLSAWSVSPDGRRLSYQEQTPETGFDLWTLPLDLSDPDHPKAGTPEVFVRTPADENVPRFSPDGRWLAYRSNESGSSEIYVRPFPAGSGGKWQVSIGGGFYPLWSRNGRELFYESLDHRIVVVEYSVSGSSFIPGKPRPWSDVHLFFPGTVNLDLAPDGKRFAVLTMPETTNGERGQVHVTMLLNLFDELQRRIPVGK